MSEGQGEAWKIKDGHGHIIIISDEPLRYVIVNGRDGEEHARRIVACVNACAGVSTEELERVASTKAPNPLASAITLGYREQQAIKQRDEALAALEDIAKEYLDPSVPASKAREAIDRITGFVGDCAGQNCAACANPCETHLEAMR